MGLFSSKKHVRTTVTRTSRTFHYFASFAIAICEGAIQGVSRIWADGKLILDYREPPDAITTNHLPTFRKDGVVTRVYLGTENQDPDGLMQLDKGEDSAPAHRGTAYVMFDSLPLADFGNRIPNINVEVVSDGTLSNKVFELAQQTTSANAIDRDAGIAYFYEAQGDRITAVNLADGNIVLGPVLGLNVTDSGIANGPTMVVDRQGFIWMPYLSGGFMRVAQIEPASLTVKRSIQVASTGIGNNARAFGTYDISPPWPAERDRYLTMAVSTKLYLINRDTGYVFSILTSPAGLTIRQVAIAPNDDLWAIVNDNFDVLRTPQTRVYRITPHPPAMNAKDNSPRYPGFDARKPVTVTLFDFTSDISYGAFIAVMPDELELLVFSQKNPPGDGSLPTGSGIAKYDISDPANPTLVDTTDIPTLNLEHSELPAITDFMHNRDGQTIGQGPLTNGEVVLRGTDTTGNFWFRLRLGDLSEITPRRYWDEWRTPNGPLPTGAFNNGFWDSSTDTGYVDITGGNAYIIPLNRWIVDEGVPLSRVCRDQSQRVGITSDKVDTTSFAPTDTTLGIGQTGPAVQTLRDLMRTYFFDGVESDFKMRFVKRKETDTPLLTLTLPDLGVQENEGEAVAYQDNRIQETELPERVDVKYFDLDRDHLVNTQESKRISLPAPTMFGRANQLVEAPVVMQATPAKQTADRWLATLWTERTEVGFKTFLKHIRLDPTDIVTLNVGTAVFNVRLLQTLFGAALGIQCSGTGSDPEVITSNSPGSTGGGFVLQDLFPIEPTLLFVLDTVLLNPGDDLGVTMYVGMAGRTGADWDGAVSTWSSDGGATKQFAASSTTPVLWGFATTTLADHPYSIWNTWDRVNTVDVFMANGVALQSATGATPEDRELDVLTNGTNPAIIGQEIVNFADVQDLGSGNYRLSRFLRGRSGTEWANSLHTNFDQFIMLTQGLKPVYLPLSVLNKQVLFEATTIGSTKITGSVHLNTQANSLKPLAPVQVENTRNLTTRILTLTWVRRSRVDFFSGDDWRNNPDQTTEMELGEASEAYEAILLDPTGATEMVGRQVLGAPIAEFTEAEILSAGYADFESDTLEFVVYQMSEAVGRGFSARRSLPPGEFVT